MLKIKDNVDLKELEKYGFEYKEDEYIKYCENEVVGVQPSRYIWIKYDGCGFCGTEIEDEGLDTIYDLIKADLVEIYKNKTIWNNWCRRFKDIEGR